LTQVRFPCIIEVEVNQIAKEGRMKATAEEMVKGVREHALANYEKGWDVVIECMTDADILEEIRGCRTVAGAIKKVKFGVDIHYGITKEIQATAW
jgi:hypothetical protein